MSIRIAILALACTLAPRIVTAQTLFSEDWSTGTIDSADWSIRGGTANAIGLEVPNQSSAGDYALALRGYQDPDFPGTNPTWFDNIMSTMLFDRGDQVTMQFKAWDKPGSNAQIGVHGGFHHTTLPPQTQAHYAQDLVTTPEAIFDYTVNDIRTSESGDGIQGGPSFFDATAAILANTKNAAATFRITLDTVQGALWELIIPPTNPAHSTGTGDPETLVGRDTRGVENFGETTGMPDTVINDQIMNAIGFGQFAGDEGTTYVDDIIVFGPDGPGGGILGDYNSNGTVDAADYVLWRKTLGTNDPQADGDDSGTVGPEDYDLWKGAFGNGSGSSSLASIATVPEPSTFMISGVCVITIFTLRRRPSSHRV
jgi:hypothetical protein